MIYKAIFAKDKIAARMIMEKLFKKGYRTSISAFKASNHAEYIRVFPMDRQLEDSPAINGFLFDEIAYPRQISKDWLALARSRKRLIESQEWSY